MIGSTTGAPRRVLITATPPTPNGDLHIGHLSGPYLGADIYSRALALRGTEHYYITGSDDHQSYVAFKGEQLDWTPARVADHFGDEMYRTLEAAGIQVDFYARPRKSRSHIPFVREFFLSLYKSGKLVRRASPSLFCTNCNRHVFEAFVSGKCPHCRCSSGGNACEDCGRPNDCADLIDPVCRSCGATPHIVSLERLYFPLSLYEHQLRRYHESVRMSPHIRAMCELMLAQGLPEIPVTHPADWGIPAPVPGFEDQRLYVWFEMAPGYLAATQELTSTSRSVRGWEYIWKSDDASVVQFFGFDNSYFHAILFPALYLAWDPEIRLPRAFVTNEFYRLDGLKFSTSRNHAIWGRQLLDGISPDAVRFYLSYTGPEREQCNFTLEDFHLTVRRELEEHQEVWLRDLGRRVSEQFNGCSPRLTGRNDEDLEGGLEEEQKEFLRSVLALVADGGKSSEPETFSPQNTTRICSELVRIARRFGKSEEHWFFPAAPRERLARSVALELLAAKAYILLMYPVAPAFGARGWEALGFRDIADAKWSEILEPLPEGQMVSGLASLGFHLNPAAVQASHAAG
jgi:methionyl-tRNA synthetase